MKKLHKQIAELAMVRAIPLTATTVPKGRLKGLMKRIAKQADKALDSLPIITQPEYEAICERIATWGEQTGWGSREKHAVTMISFALAMIEQSEFKHPSRLIETLTDVVDHYDRIGKAPLACCCGGAWLLKSGKR